MEPGEYVFRVWAEGGEKAICCQMARGRTGWFLVPGIPTKDVPLRKDVTADRDAKQPMKPIRLPNAKRTHRDARNHRRALS